MRLLLFAQQLAAFRSGVGTYAHGLAKGLAALGHRVTVVVPRGEEVDLEGVRTVAVARSKADPTPGGWLSLGGAFARVLEKEGPLHDLAHFTDAREAWRVRNATIPILGMANDCYGLDWLAPEYPRSLFDDRRTRGLYYAVLRWIERPTYRRLTAVLANSRHVADAITSGYGLDSSRVSVVRYGVPSVTIEHDSPLLGSPAVLFVGANFQRKGLGVLLQAVARMRSSHPELRVHVVGRDRNQPALEKTARGLALDRAVIFHGWQPNDRVRKMMAGADIFALPSLTEGFGLVYLEAMAAGVPVIATPVGGAAEVFRDGVEVLFADPRDPEALAAALRRLADDPAAAQRLAEAGREAAQRFTVEAMVTATEAVFREALGKARQAGGAEASR